MLSWLEVVYKWCIASYDSDRMTRNRSGKMQEAQRYHGVHMFSMKSASLYSEKTVTVEVLGKLHAQVSKPSGPLVDILLLLPCGQLERWRAGG